MYVDSERLFCVKRLLMKVFFISALFLAVFFAPGIARAETRVYVTASISGGIIAGGAYIIWSIMYSGRVANAPKNEYAPGGDVPEYGLLKTHETFLKEDVSEFKMELLKIRF